MEWLFFIAVAILFWIYNTSTAIEKIKKQLEETQAELGKTQEELNQAKRERDSEYAKASEATKSERQTKKDRDSLLDFNKNILAVIGRENALLPSVVEWVSKLEEMQDRRESGWLLAKKRPAVKASEAVAEAKAEAREWKKQATTFRNQVALYEAEVPWLPELLNYSLNEINEGLRLAENERSMQASGEDPGRAYLSSSEWNQLTPTRRGQLALDRYFEFRQKNAWLAGIAYERFVGHFLESEYGWSVTYHGAVKGKYDGGLDLVCLDEYGHHWLVQCKRYSETKGIPVRENTVAQTYGSALFYAHQNRILQNNFTPIIITSFELSGEAVDFSDALGVRRMEKINFKRYPCIKCNISKNGDKIYHLPFDQQYDKININKDHGDFYAMTTAEAEAAGFRRAYRWKGSN